MNEANRVRLAKRNEIRLDALEMLKKYGCEATPSTYGICDIFAYNVERYLFYEDVAKRLGLAEARRVDLNVDYNSDDSVR